MFAAEAVQAIYITTHQERGIEKIKTLQVSRQSFFRHENIADCRPAIPTVF